MKKKKKVVQNLILRRRRKSENLEEDTELTKKRSEYYAWLERIIAKLQD